MNNSVAIIATITLANIAPVYLLLNIKEHLKCLPHLALRQELETVFGIITIKETNDSIDAANGFSKSLFLAKK